MRKAGFRIKQLVAATLRLLGISAVRAMRARQQLLACTASADAVDGRWLPALMRPGHSSGRGEALPCCGRIGYGFPLTRRLPELFPSYATEALADGEMRAWCNQTDSGKGEGSRQVLFTPCTVSCASICSVMVACTTTMLTD